MNKLASKVGAARRFTGQVADELRKSSWPTGGELMESTLVVILSVIILSVFVGICDLALEGVLRWLLP